MRRLAVLVLTVGALGLAPAPAHAQRYFGGFTGYTYDGVAGDCASLFDDCPNRRTGYGLVGGGLSGGVFGLEQEYAWTNGIFGQGGEVSESKVTTLMTSVLVGVPIGPLRPYGAFGIGLMRARMEFSAEGVRDFSDTSFGRNYGAGVLLLLPAHLAIRLDYRRFRSGAEVPVPAGTDNKLRFSRASIGVVLH